MRLRPSGIKRCSPGPPTQLNVAEPLPTQGVCWALRHIFILFLREVHGPESLRSSGKDRGAQS